MARARNRDAVLKTLRDVARGGPHEDVHRRDLQARPRRDDAPERHRGRARDHVPALPDLRRRGRHQLRGDDRDRVRAPAARASATRRPSGVEAFLVQMNPRVSAQFTGDGARVLHALEERDRQASSTSRAPRACRSTTSRSRWRARADEVEERAVPFREGDEVLVHIVEPHMYDVDDAVAKIDGYIVVRRRRGPARRREAPRAHRARPDAPPRRAVARRPDRLRARRARDGGRRR